MTNDINHLPQSYKNLVFEGGGVKGSAYAGCVQVLDENNLLEKVENVAGTSAGSITAALLAIGAGSKGLTESILDVNFDKFIADRGWIFGDLYRAFRHFGIHSGDGFVKVLKSYFAKYTNNADLTFAELEILVKNNPIRYKSLSVVASNITTQKIYIFDCKSTPKVPIWQAVRCSMSIPFVFEPYVINDNYFMDGGLGWAYPLEIYDDIGLEGGNARNPHTLGFYLEPQKHIRHPGFNPEQMEIKSLKNAATATYNFLYNSANSKYIHPEDKKRTVFIDDLGISGTEFNITKMDIHRLIRSGREATALFLGVDVDRVE